MLGLKLSVNITCTYVHLQERSQPLCTENNLAPKYKQSNKTRTSEDREYIRNELIKLISGKFMEAPMPCLVPSPLDHTCFLVIS